MGFRHKWLTWIYWCISTAYFSILVNGTPVGFFQSSRGLRQGDPLPSYLFVLGMNILSHLINKAVGGNFLIGCKLGIRGEEDKDLVLSHLLYVDDTLLFYKANPDQLTHLGWILMWFKALSDLRTNLGKSEIFHARGRRNMEALAVELGCKVSSLPSTYLGLPLGAPHKSARMWDPIEERFRRRLTAWKRQYISKGGRVTLIHSTLSSLPIYFMPLFRIPCMVCKRLEKIQMDFLWGGGNLDQKTHLVKWATVCTNKRKGGLGVRGLQKLNQALLGKWNWRFANEGNALWRETINKKFGEMQVGWCYGENRENFGPGLWKEIRKDWGAVLDNAKFQIGDGNRVGFWKDLWCGEKALCRSYLTLFSLVVNKEVMVREVWDNSGVGGWSPGFIRSFNDWELMEVENSLHAIQPMRVISNKEEKLILKGNKTDTYFVKLNRLVSLPLPFPVLSIWNPLVPLKVGFFA